MDGMAVDEDSFVMIEPVVANSLEDGLSFRQKRQVEHAVPYLVIPLHILLFP